MSMKKFSLIAAAASIAVLAMASSALANNGASLSNAKADPVNNIPAGLSQQGGLYLDVTNCESTDASCISSGGTAPTQVSDGVWGTQVSWSGQVSVAPSKQPVCAQATIAALTYQNAMKACNGSVQGTGGATVCLGGLTTGTPCSAVQAKVIVFRGPDFTDPDLGGGNGLFGKAGKVYKSVNLYADIGVGVAVIPAVFTPASKATKAFGPYKTTLNVFGSGPHVAPPSQSITDFWANVNAGVKVKCGLAGQTGSVNIDYLGVWDTSATPQGQPDKNDPAQQACSYQP
ncbi:MAG: hypothetical protein U0R51_10695 [Solirubrobacterales bacterium]